MGRVKNRCLRRYPTILEYPAWQIRRSARSQGHYKRRLAMKEARYCRILEACTVLLTLINQLAGEFLLISKICWHADQEQKYWIIAWLNCDSNELTPCCTKTLGEPRKPGQMFRLVCTGVSRTGPNREGIWWRQCRIVIDLEMGNWLIERSRPCLLPQQTYETLLDVRRSTFLWTALNQSCEKLR